MKSLLLNIAIVSLVIGKSIAQEKPHFKLSTGVNIINNIQLSDMPWSIDKLDFNKPLYLGLDYQINSKWSFGVNASTNRIETAKPSARLYAVQTEVNYYIIPNTARKYRELFVLLAGGMYSFSDTRSVIVSPGLGFNYWFLPSVAVSVSGRANAAMNNKEPLGSYYQCNIGLVWRFVDEI